MVMITQTAVLSRTITHIEVENDTAFVVSDNLLIYDVSNPANPQLLIEYPVAGFVSDMFVENGRLYLAELSNITHDPAQDGGITVLDVSNPAAPFPIQTYEPNNTINSIAKYGNYLYAGNNDGSDSWGLAVIDLSVSGTLTHTTFLTNLPTVKMAIDGNYLYRLGPSPLNSSQNRLYVHDITDPLNPTFVNSIDTQNFSENLLEIHDGEIYAINFFGLYAYDISNPQDLTSWRTISVNNRSGSLQDVAFVNERLFMAYGSGGMVQFDQSTSPKTLTSSFDNLGGASQVVANGQQLFVGNSDAKGVHLFERTTPELPTAVNNSPFWSSGFLSFGVNNNTLIGLTPWRLHTYHISNPLSPTLIMSQTLNSAYSSNHKMVTSGNYAYLYVDDSGSNRFEVWDMANPANLVQKSSETLSTTWDTVSVEGNFVFFDRQTYPTDRFTIIDATNPAQPQERGVYTTTGLITYHLVEQEIAYLAQVKTEYSGETEILIVDISDKDNPVLINTIPYMQATNQVRLAVEGNLLAVTGQTPQDSQEYGTVQLYDISDLNNIVPLDMVTIPDGGQEIAILDGVVYVANGRTGLFIFDTDGQITITAVPEFLYMPFLRK